MMEWQSNITGVRCPCVRSRVFFQQSIELLKNNLLGLTRDAVRIQYAGLETFWRNAPAVPWVSCLRSRTEALNHGDAWFRLVISFVPRARSGPWTQTTTFLLEGTHSCLMASLVTEKFGFRRAARPGLSPVAISCELSDRPVLFPRTSPGAGLRVKARLRLGQVPPVAV